MMEGGSERPEQRVGTADLGDSDPGESSLEQLLPPRIQAVQFLHHDCGKKKRERHRKRGWFASHYVAIVMPGGLIPQ